MLLLKYLIITLTQNSTKSGVLAALKEENKKIGSSESEQCLKAETKRQGLFLIFQLVETSLYRKQNTRIKSRCI